ncbi:hypothetical protein [uncultured Alsobacter sp.]|uniref:hypothetical protein n=1 Tax=uncultured Alsobacter sp. TaxID=1748258 RepID=UPI0025CD5CDA|nr:hypothetical protein [uncultured Alsobacter sp.]
MTAAVPVVRALRRACLCALALVALAATPAWAQKSRELTATVTSRTVPTLCAEDDNVYLTLSGAKIRHFRIEARHPAVIGSIVVDSTAPDFTNCTIEDKPPGPERKDDRIVLFEDDAMILVGYRGDPAFWRKDEVPLRVGTGAEEHNIHLVQLFMKRPGKEPYEYLVLYPMDGYWRARPLPPERLPQVAYGTSFLVGRVDEKQRPFVAIKSIKFDPRAKIFELTFPKGDVTTVRVESVTDQATKIEVMFEKPVSGRPFAALRSMFVTDANADSAVVAYRQPWKKGWEQRHVMDFRGTQASELWLGRTMTSRHNTSAPDTLIYDIQPD